MMEGRVIFVELRFVDIFCENYHLVELLNSDPSINKYIHVSENYVDYLLRGENVIFKFIFLEEDLVGGLHIETLEQVATFSIQILTKHQKRGIGTQVINALKQNIFFLDIVLMWYMLKKLTRPQLSCLTKMVLS